MAADDASVNEPMLPYLQAAVRISGPALAGSDARGAFETCACAARLILRTVPGSEEARQQLRVSLGRCVSVTDSEIRALVLRQTFDAIAPETLDPDVLPGADDSEEALTVTRTYLDLAISIGAPAYNEGDHHGCYEVYACTARMILRSVAINAEVRRLLTEALEQAALLEDSSRQAWTMRHAFDAIAAPSRTPLEVIRSYLTMAIQIGAPAYNYGDHRGCYEVYACTARLILQAVRGADDSRERLRNALARCQAIDDSTRQAWVMRRAFDVVLGEEASEEGEEE
jgi:hypothetical protein